jgi:hypothetical protein
MEFLDAQDGTMGQNLDIFDLKEKVTKAFRDFAPTACSTVQRTGESQNFDHDNVYEYLIDYATHMIDSKGSKYDPDDNDFILSTPPLELEVDLSNSISETESNAWIDSDGIAIHDYDGTTILI